LQIVPCASGFRHLRRSLPPRRRPRLQLPALYRSAGKQIENRAKPALHLGEPVPRVLAKQLVERRIRGDGRGFFFEPTPGAGERQAFDQQQMLDPQDLLDVAATVHARTARGFRDAQLGKLALPRPQDVRLHMDELADLGRLEQGALRNLNLTGRFGHGKKYSPNLGVSYFFRRRTWMRIGVPWNSKCSRN
jgi:hypothetical protein